MDFYKGDFVEVAKHSRNSVGNYGQYDRGTIVKLLKDKYNGDDYAKVKFEKSSSVSGDGVWYVSLANLKKIQSA